MKRILYILISVIVTAVSCQKYSFDYTTVKVSEDRVDTIIFNTSHYTVYADGVSALKMRLEPCYFANEERTYTRVLPLSSFNDDDIKYFYEDSGKTTEIESDFIIFDEVSTPTTVQVYATVFGKESRKIDVTIYPKWGNSIAEKTIPVVFHIFQYVGTDNTEFVINPIHLDEKLRLLNNAFSRTISDGANSVDTKIRFVAATEDPNGKTLTNAGINNIKLLHEELSFDDYEMYFDNGNTTDFNWDKFLSDNLAYWSNNNTLNIWIIPNGKVKIPAYTPSITTASTNPFEGFTLTEVGSNYVVKPTEAGIVINYSSFIPSSLNYTIGEYYGLLDTSNSTVVNGDSDYCFDTFMYNEDDDSYERKNAINVPITYISDNIMDDESQSISVSAEQAKRIHWIIDNSPAR